MAPAPLGKGSGFRREGDNWFCISSLPVDLVVAVDEVKFHIHKFPLISKCGNIATLFEESQSIQQLVFDITLEEFPGGADTFISVVKFCYGNRVEFTPRNTISLYCAADYLEMTDDYGEDNLQSKLENYFHSNILKRWEDCVLALQSCEPVLVRADKLQLSSRCINAMSVMICTDPSLFGWPMRMYGSLQSPGGSILWNGINTGAKIHSDESDWWFEDASYLCVELFERLIRTTEARGINPKILARAIMYYCSKYLPGLGRWQAGETAKSRTVTVKSFGMTPANVNQRALLETVIKLLPDKRGKSFCRFVLGLLRVSLIMGVNHECRDGLERRIGVQLEFATLDSLLIPSYSDSAETLYDCDCVERMMRHFVLSEVNGGSISHSSRDQDDTGSSQWSGRLKRVSKLVDDYLAEVASDVNLKPGKFRRLAEILPDSSRNLHDGLYRALDIYLKAHPWLAEKDCEHLCSIIDFQKLSIDACAHASQNERLPIRIVLQVLFFEQMHLRSALASYLNVLGPETAPLSIQPVDGGGSGQERWVAVARQNRNLTADMERMMSRVGELEQEFNKMREEMKKMSKSSHGGSPALFSIKGMGCKLIPRARDSGKEIFEASSALTASPGQREPIRKRTSFSRF